jgi:hypothetical protein
LLATSKRINAATCDASSTRHVPGKGSLFTTRDSRI